MFHLSSAVDARLPPVEVNGDRQSQVQFDLPGWSLRLAKIDTGPFPFVLEAVPDGPVIADTFESLQQRVFALLCFLSGRPVGMHPICGLSSAGTVVWAAYANPRSTSTVPGFRWMPPRQQAKALPKLANGWEKLAEHPGREEVVDRLVALMVTANGAEVLETRLITACAGLELAGWLVLQQEGWAGAQTLKSKDVTAGAITRLLLQWAGIPTGVPNQFEELLTWAKKAGGERPEVAFMVRNRVIHPPKKLSVIQWPGSEVLLDAWRLATWYLELVILRLLGYTGKYRSRLNLPASEFNLVDLPWTPGTGR